MGRTNYALMSLVAAVPGAVLAFILVMGFLNHADKMPVALTVVAGVSLLVAALVAVTPVGLLLFGGGGPAKAGKASKQKKAKAAKATVPAMDEVEAYDTADTLDTDESFVTDEDYSDDFDASGDWDDDVETAPEASDSEFAESDLDEFEFDDSSSEFDATFDFDDDEKQ